MPLTDAVDLQNFFPSPSRLDGRGGYTTWATGTTGNVKTLANYNPMVGSNKLLGFTSSGVYNVSASGAVGASLLARTNGKHQWFDFSDGTSNWLVALNGADKPFYYDGTTATAVDAGTSPALIGITSSLLVSGFVFKGRIMFIPTQSLSFWYLPAGVVGGTLTEFDLGPEFPRGGYLVAGGTWTIDGGDGVDDLAVFVSSEGEVAVYRGTNPSSAAAWAKVGIYTFAKPIGRRCLAKYGADLTLLTEAGLFTLSSALPSASVNDKFALSYKIEPTLTAAARLYSSVFGWETILYPQQSALIVNVPQTEDGVHVQFAMNTITKAWGPFLGWNAETFAIFNGELYFASGTGTVKAWNGTADGSTEIVFYGKQAFSDFGYTGVEKSGFMFQPIFATTGSFAFLTDIDVDYQDQPITGTATFTVTSGAVWDVSLWDVGFWAPGLEVVKDWTSPDTFPGVVVSGKVKIATTTLQVQWLGNSMMFQLGGPL